MKRLLLTLIALVTLTGCATIEGFAEKALNVDTVTVSSDDMATLQVKALQKKYPGCKVGKSFVQKDNFLATQAWVELPGGKRMWAGVCKVELPMFDAPLFNATPLYDRVITDDAEIDDMPTSTRVGKQAYRHAAKVGGLRGRLWN